MFSCGAARPPAPQLRLEARTGAAPPRPSADTSLPRRKGSAPSGPRPRSLHMRPRRPSLKPPGAPRAGPGGRGRGQSASEGARPGLVGFGEEEEEEGVANAETKPRRVPGTGAGSGPGARRRPGRPKGFARRCLATGRPPGARPRPRSASPGPRPPGPLLLGQAAARPPLPCGSGPK